MTRVSRYIILFVILSFCRQGRTLAQSAPHDWAYLDPVSDSVVGISLFKAYAHLGVRPHTTVIVAIIDNGFDIEHPDLKRVIWTNPREIAGNHIDDDHNGYVDDVHGWNFRSSPDGALAENDQMESTRIYAQWRGRFEAADTGGMIPEVRRQLDLYRTAKQAYLEKLKGELTEDEREFAYNAEYDPSRIIGDHATDPTEKSYGSPSMRLTPQLTHGTHVAGIVAADRTNGVGVMGVADHVLIMPVVATTAAGDERDKDVANAIRYAVDNGARIINMSFSKILSQYKCVVDDAVRYAEANNVLPAVFTSGLVEGLCRA